MRLVDTVGIRKQTAAVSHGVHLQSAGIPYFSLQTPGLLVKMGPLRAVIHLAGGDEKTADDLSGSYSG